MKKTENYHLSQWDLTDPIKMDDFNSDNAAIETALTNLAKLAAGGAQADALAAARAELEAAIEAEKKRVDAELAKKASASDLSSAKSSLESAVSKLDGDKAGFVIVQESNVGVGTNSLYLNIAALNLSQYSIISLRFTNPPLDCKLGLNGTNGTCYAAGGTGIANNGYIAPVTAGVPVQVLMFPMRSGGSRICTLTFSSGVWLGYSSITYEELYAFHMNATNDFNRVPVYYQIRAIK